MALSMVTAITFLRPGAIPHESPGESSTAYPFGYHSGGTAISVGAQITGSGGGGVFGHAPTALMQQHEPPAH